MNSRLLKDAPPGAIALPSPSGWIDSKLFVTYMEHFIKFANPTENKPILVLLDGQKSHKSLELIELARRNYLSLITHPQHTSHRLQPLHLTFFFTSKNII